MKNLKTFFIFTFGCQMNELDSEILSTQLENKNLKKLKTEADADLIIFNTCSIRALAEKKVVNKLAKYKENKNKIIGICGCMSMLQKDYLLKNFPYINFILGTNNILDINNILDDILSKNIQIERTHKTYEKALEEFIPKRSNPIKASISIIRGCNNFCTYCVVPFSRGKEVSRTPLSIIREAKYLANKGYKEITLLGQNVNSYGKDSHPGYLFPDLLYELEKIAGIERIRFMTSHPKDITKDLMHAIKDLKKICEFIHFPLQSGSNPILKRMNRKYTKESYLEKIQSIKEIIPNAAIGTDIIVGFPDETDEDFMQTYNIFKQVQFDQAFIFAYSPRENTIAYKFDDNISQKTKQKRLQLLLELYHKILKEKFTLLIGSEKEILIESLNKNGFLKGRTRQFEKIICKGDKALIGSLQKVQVHNFNHQTLIGAID